MNKHTVHEKFTVNYYSVWNNLYCLYIAIATDSETLIYAV